LRDDCVKKATSEAFLAQKQHCKSRKEIGGEGGLRAPKEENLKLMKN